MLGIDVQPPTGPTGGFAKWHTRSDFPGKQETPNARRIYLQAIYDGLGVAGPILDSGRRDHKATIRAFEADPNLTPKAAHAAWLRRKAAGGWTLGRSFDPVAKTQPQIKHRGDLPPHERRAEEAGIHALRNWRTAL